FLDLCYISLHTTIETSPYMTLFRSCVTGLLSFVRLVSWFLKKYHDTTVSVLAGFMVGSLYKVWPWKITVTSRMNSDGELVPLLQDRKSTRLNSSHVKTSYAFLCLYK